MDMNLIYILILILVRYMLLFVSLKHLIYLIGTELYIMQHDNQRAFYFLYILFGFIPLFEATFKVPSYISEWTLLRAYDSNLAQVTIAHPLGEYPAKVEVQVKVTEHGEDYVFTGFGSAHIDDDINVIYGGVIYKYNNVDVTLFAPGDGNHYNSGLVAYTGGNNYAGPSTIQGSYIECYARVRLWKQSDLGLPSFEESGIVMNVDDKLFKEINHGLNAYPDLVSVQTMMEDGYISDGQGAVFNGIQGNTGNMKLHMGGLVYGYDENKIRMWTPKNDGEVSHFNGIFSVEDKWGYDNRGNYRHNGTVRVRMWVLPESYIVYSQTISPFGVGINSTNQIDFPQEYTLDRYLISVEVTIGNLGLRFQGAGSCFNDGAETMYQPFGGVVYVYTNKTVLLYIPKEASGGHLVFIGGRWGDGQYSEVHDNGSVTVRVLQPRHGFCEYTEKESAVNMIKGGSGLFSTQTNSLLECSYSCLSHVWCISFFYHPLSMTCTGHDQMYEVTGLQVGMGYKYYTCLAQEVCD